MKMAHSTKKKLDLMDLSLWKTKQGNPVDNRPSTNFQYICIYIFFFIIWARDGKKLGLSWDPVISIPTLFQPGTFHSFADKALFQTEYVKFMDIYQKYT